jgi:hypothetical protein
MKAIDKILADTRVSDLWKDSDGWWCILKDGYEYEPQSQTLHEYTLSAIKECLKYVY